MAETTKRTSINTRVATPRISSPSIPSALSSDAAIAKALGARVRITTTSTPPRSFEGHLFSAHTPSNILTLTPTFPPAQNTTPAFTVLTISSIQKLEIISPYTSQPQSSASADQTSKPTSQTSLPSLPPLPPSLDSATQATRIQASIDKILEADSRRGKGVSKEAQEIFDAISKTLPTEWEGENIVVLKEVVIGKPYRVEDCRPIKGAGNAGMMVGRIRKVLENERKKIADRNGATSTSSPAAAAATNTGPRRGG